MTQRLFTSLLVFLCCVGVAFAQNRTITGTVVDGSDIPIIGANVLVVGTTTGVITNVDGEFTLEVPPQAKLQVSYIGYVTQTINVGNQTKLKIQLHEDSQTLDELVVVGYSMQRRESLTGSLSTVKDEKLKDVTTPSVENMLNSKIPGVYVQPGTGQPGSTGAMMIRGKATISGNTAPLWVIDGVIVGYNSGDLNPADIESLTVLKDAASTAIYGSQGANGVIVVTTKSGRAEKMTINASVKLGISRLNNGNLVRNSNFDWWDLATQTGFTQDYNISITGGNEKITSYFSLGYYDETGAVKGYDYSRYNFRYRTSYKPFKWLTIKPSISGSMRDVRDAQYWVSAMYSNMPWDSPYDENGELVPHRYGGWWNSTGTNYLLDLSYGNYTSYKTYDFMGNFDFDIRFTDWLTFSSVNSYHWTGYYWHSYTDPRSNSGISVNGRLDEYQQNRVYRYTNQLLRFNKAWGKHSVNALLGYEFNDYQNKTIRAIGTGFNPGFEVLDVTALPESVGGALEEWATQSYFFNAHYSYDNRYLGQVSFRRDGASNFGDDVKYGNFFSVSAAWNIHNEEWFKADWVNELKLRASYGSVGNRPSSLYPQYDLYSVSVNYNGLPATLINQVGNRDLTWEKTYTTGVGFDAAMFDNRLRVSFDYYNKYTSNILYAVPVSGLTGVTSRWQNVGEMRNHGIELNIGGDIISTKDWTWTVEANLGHNSNELKKLYGENAWVIIGDGSGIAGAASKILKPGYSVDCFYLREWAGVNPDNGAPQWYKTVENADGSTSREITSNYSEADQVICAASTPKLFGGFNTNLRWKDLDLSASFGYSIGGKIYNYQRLEMDSDGAYTDRNQMKLQDGWSRWEKPGDIATHPVASYQNNSQSNLASTRFLEDGDFLKLRSLTIGYNWRLPQYYIQNLRVYFTGENLFTITKYSGVDPELSYGGYGVTTDNAQTPRAKSYTLGITVDF